MAAKGISVKKYVVRLSGEERERLAYGPYLRAMSYLPPKLQCDVVAVLCDESRGMKELNTTPWRNLYQSSD